MEDLGVCSDCERPILLFDEDDEDEPPCPICACSGGLDAIDRHLRQIDDDGEDSPLWGIVRDAHDYGDDGMNIADHTAFVMAAAAQAFDDLSHRSRRSRYERLGQEELIKSPEMRSMAVDSEYERELRALIAAQRAENSRVENPRSRPLPDLSPEMLLSPAARNELRAAQGMSMGVQASRGRAEVPRFPEEDLSRTPDISTLFMGREAMEAADAAGLSLEDLGPMHQDFETFSGSDIEFDTSDTMEGRTSPNESARFQIGRESPRVRPFQSSRVSGPSDGEIVSRRTAGRFQATQERRPVAPAMSPRTPVTAARSTPAPTPRTSTSPAPTVRGASAIERLVRPSFLDDD